MAARSAGRRVTGPHRHRQLGCGAAEPGGLLGDALQGDLEVLVHIGGEGPQRRDVDDPGAGRAGRQHGRELRLATVGGVDGDQEPGERLARTGGRGHQHVLARHDPGPGAALRLGRARGNRSRNQLATAGWKVRRMESGASRSSRASRGTDSSEGCAGPPPAASPPSGRVPGPGARFGSWSPLR